MRYLVFLMIIIVGCKPAVKPVASMKVEPAMAGKKKINDDASIDYAEIDKNDSIQLNVMLSDMLRIANQLKDRSDYHKQLNQWNYTCETTGDIRFGHLFARDKRHLVIKRNMGTWLTHIDVFLLDRSSFRLVLNTVITDMTMLGDSIREINGDHFKDFVVHWYPSSGCCRRNIYYVYLYQKDKGTFTPKYEFINPTFSASEKIIRGIDYGQPGEGPLYKYKWNGLHVDTIEYIYPSDTIQKGLPSEYRKIEDIDWFIDHSIGELPKTHKTKVR